MVQIYRRRAAAKRISGHDQPRHDGSARDRGYDARWDALSAEYRRKHPFCEECERRGRIKLCDVVDHIIPAADMPNRRLDPENLASLCHDHHNGIKRRLEGYARKAKKLEYLVVWLRKPETRPFTFRFEQGEARL